MKYLKIIVVFFLLTQIYVFAQVKDMSKPQVEKKSTVLSDFKILNSNSSYLEIEFYPQYSSNTGFSNSVKDDANFGKPDVEFRYFPVIFPVDYNNKIEILDSKFTEEYNIDINPVPTPKKANNKYEVLFDYKRDEKTYSSNNFFPANVVSIDNIQKVRNKYISGVKVFPVIWNPISKSSRKYSYIRFRVSFGGSPVYNNKNLSKEEISLLNNIAVNSNTAINWSTKDFNNLKSSVQNSILATGDFFKIEFKETGIYKIDKNFLLSAGINVNSIDPRTIKIYYNGSASLPYNNASFVPNDLQEVKIFVYGEADGHFDDNDYILFYGISTKDWTYDSINGIYSHIVNSYTNSAFCWLTYGGNNGIRITETPSINLTNLPVVNNFTEKFFDKQEINNLGSTGMLWLSQRISVGESFSFSHSLPGYIDGSLIKFVLRIGNSTSSEGVLLVKDDNSPYSVTTSLPGNYGIFSHISLITFQDSYSLYPGKNVINLNASLPSQYNTPNISSYYDYIEVFYQRGFNSVQNNYLNFSAKQKAGPFEFQISPYTSSEVKIFDVTNLQNVKLITPISYINGIVRFQDDFISGLSKQYIVDGNNYKSPISISQRVPNQNIHGISDGASFIIISPTEFLPAATRLKTYRESFGPGSPYYLKTFIFDINQIYNEFSCGKQDPVAVRNFLKNSYNNWQERPVYVLFLGDGSYDYKNIYGLNVKNFIPPIERPDPDDQNNEINSYPSDDFLTEINESHLRPEPCRTDFAYGRLNVNSLSEANGDIDKIMSYESQNNLGDWKKKIMYVGDDGWTTENNQGQEGNQHTQQCEDIAELHTPKDFEKEKIYIVTYPTVITPQGRRKPGANIDIIKGWNEGRLAINYVGHGSTDLWAHEHIFVRDETIPQLVNGTKLPLVTIASCDLARWDDPFSISAGEQLVNIQNGAIAVVAAVRPVYSANNAAFNNLLWDNYMYVKDTLNIPIRIGSAMFNVKNQLPEIVDNDLKFCLVGDPTLRVSIPQYFTRVDSINNTPLYNTINVDTIKALQKITIKGSILRPDSSLWNNFNGNINIKIFDVSKNIIFWDFGYPFYFRLDGGTIFKGNTRINNGKWVIAFIVPKDISYNTGRGNLKAYFTDQVYEGSGYSDRFVMNGIDTTAIVDTTGPVITLFMDNRNFKTGDLVNQNTKLIADLYDVSGINLTGSIGHKIEAIINNNESTKIDLTSYYNSTTNFQNGTVEYPFDNLSDGKYSIKFRAWDTYNNLSEKIVDFSVKNNSALFIDKVYNYPNPMKDNTNFTFEHNFNVALSAKIKIYSVSGRLIKEIIRTNITDKFVSIYWDGRDNDGDAIANGTYIYKLIIKTDDNSYSNTSTGKLAKLK